MVYCEVFFAFVIIFSAVGGCGRNDINEIVQDFIKIFFAYSIYWRKV